MLKKTLESKKLLLRAVCTLEVKLISKRMMVHLETSDRGHERMEKLGYPRESQGGGVHVVSCLN